MSHWTSVRVLSNASVVSSLLNATALLLDDDVIASECEHVCVSVVFSGVSIISS